MKTQELTTVENFISTQGLEPTTAKSIREQFINFFEQAEIWREKAAQIKVTDESQTDLMKAAKEARIAIGKIRINADKKRKEMKEDSIRYGKAVQGVYNIIEFLIKPIEDHLRQQEDFIAIQRQEKLRAIREERQTLINPYAEFIPFGICLENLSEADFTKLLAGAKLQKKAADDEEERRAEAEKQRQAEEEAEKERIRQENERLKAEAQKQADELKAEQEKRKQAEEEKQRLFEQEQKRIRQEQEAERIRQEQEQKAQQAPDKEKLLALAEAIDSITIPELKSKAAKAILQAGTKMLKELVSFIQEKANQL